MLLTENMCAPSPRHGDNGISSSSSALFSNFRKMETARKQIVEAVLECVVERRRFTYSDIFVHREGTQKFVRGVE